MTISVLQKTPNATTPNRVNSATALTTDAFASNIAEGSMIVAYGTAAAAAVKTFTLSDSKNNTWFKDKEYMPYLTDYYCGVVLGHCYIASGKGGSGLTVTMTANATTNYMELGAAEVSGVETGIGAGASANNQNTGTGSPLDSGQVTPSGNHFYLSVGLWNTTSTVTITKDANWTERHQDGSATYATLAQQDRISAGNQTSEETFSPSKQWACGIVAYKEATAGLDQSMRRTILCG